MPLATALNTGSTVTLPTGKNKTSTALSTNIVVLVNKTPVGAIQSISITENRPGNLIYELGTDGAIDSHPKSSTTYTVNCKRTRFDKLRIAQAFGRGFIHPQSQRYPFDVVIIDRQSDDESNHIITTLKNCWITKVSYSYSSNEWAIAEDMDLQIETLFSTLGAGANPVGDIIAPRLIDAFKNEIERSTDVGVRRGSLDASGLIDLGSNGENLY